MLSYVRNITQMLVQDRRAVTAIEYALIAALIAMVIITAVTTLGSSVSNTFISVSSEL
jgi:pilus assembly protein Flp/PilA